MENNHFPEETARQLQKQRAEAELRRKKRRGRKIAWMAGGCAAIVLLSVGSLLLTRYNTKKQAEEEAKTQPQLTVAVLPASGSVDTLTFTDSTGVQRSFVQDSAGSWSWADDADFPVDGTQLDTLLESAAQLKAYLQFTPQEGQEYGLDQPQQTILLTDSQTGETNALYLGAVNEVSGQLYLQSGEDGTTLYSVDSSLLDTFALSLFDLMQPEQMALPATQEDITGFTVQDPTTGKLQFTAWDDPDGVDLTGSCQWCATQGALSLPVDGSTGSTLLGRLATLQPDTCVAWKPDEAALAEYGLDEDSRTLLELRYTDADGQAATARVYIGCTVTGEENCYMAVEGYQGVYLQTCGKLQGFVQATAEDFTSTLPFAVSGDYLTGITVNREGESALALVRTVTESTDEEGTTTQETSYTLNGEALTGTGGSDFVSAMAALTGTDLQRADALPEQTADITVTLHLQQRALSEAVIYLYRQTEDSYTVYYTRGTDADTQQLLCVSLAAADWQAALDTLTADPAAE